MVPFQKFYSHIIAPKLPHKLPRCIKYVTCNTNQFKCRTNYNVPQPWFWSVWWWTNRKYLTPSWRHLLISTATACFDIAPANMLLQLRPIALCHNVKMAMERNRTNHTCHMSEVNPSMYIYSRGEPQHVLNVCIYTGLLAGLRQMTGTTSSEQGFAKLLDYGKTRGALYVLC